MTDQTESEQPDDYTVLARKYRPTSFEGLIGQEAMVRTLTNAIGSGRLAHAFVLTGVRGIGKTTTARIIARVLNCIGEDGTGGFGRMVPPLAFITPPRHTTQRCPEHFVVTQDDRLCERRALTTAGGTDRQFVDSLHGSR